MAGETVFWHERLEVYQRALAFVQRAEVIGGEASESADVLGHLDRASESVAEGIVTGNSHWSAEAKSRYFGIAYGSALECAACLDVCSVLALVPAARCRREKMELRTLVRMLVGLIRSQQQGVHEPSAEYEVTSDSHRAEPCFDHERLEVYQAALGFVGWAKALTADVSLGAARRKKLDALSTSIVLNIAEGNGRFEIRDHRHFLDIAHRSTLRAALQLDLIGVRMPVTASSIAEGKRTLGSIVRMLLAMRGHFAREARTMDGEDGKERD